MVSFVRWVSGTRIEIIVPEGEKVYPIGIPLQFGLPIGVGDRFYYISDDTIDLEFLMDYWIDRLGDMPHE